MRATTKRSLLVLWLIGVATACATGADGGASDEPDAEADGSGPGEHDARARPGVDAAREAATDEGGAVDGGRDGSVVDANDASSSDASGGDEPVVEAGTDGHVKKEAGDEEAGKDGGKADSGKVDSGKEDSGGKHDAGSKDAGAKDTGSTCPFAGFTGTLAAFDMTGQKGDEVSVAASSTASGITASVLARASALSAVDGTDSINSSDWGKGSSADPTRYYTFTVTPASTCALDLSTLTLDVGASSTGPSNGDVATSADAFVTHTAAFAGTSKGSVTLTSSGSVAIELRVYGYGATTTEGTFRISDTMTLSGSIH